jgi:hypothetical protein
VTDSGSDCYYADHENESDTDQCEQVADMAALYHKITVGKLAFTTFIGIKGIQLEETLMLRVLWGRIK